MGYHGALTFDFKIIYSKLIFLPNCTKVANLVKCPQAVYKVSIIMTLTNIQ